MPRGIHQKEKLLVLLEVLNRESDEEHPVPLSELLAALSREEISAERKSIYDDMEIRAAGAGTWSWSAGRATIWPPAPLSWQS